MQNVFSYKYSLDIQIQISAQNLKCLWEQDSRQF